MRDILGTFWSRVDTNGDCWLWTGPTYHDGYGAFTHGRRFATRAHRFALETTARQPIASGLLAIHSCDNRLCVNPAHLRAGTHADNMRDCLERGRHPNTNRTHCRYGHLYDTANTGRRKDGSRRCRTCDRLAARKEAA